MKLVFKKPAPAPEQQPESEDCTRHQWAFLRARGARDEFFCQFCLAKTDRPT